MSFTDTQEKLQQSLEHYRVMTSLLTALQSAQTPLQVMETTVGLLQTLPWMGLQTKAAGFIWQPTKQRLDLIFAQNLSGEQHRICAHIRPGQCLCGRALVEQHLLLANSACDDHTLHPQKDDPHGHALLPLIHHEQTLGLLNFYMPAESTLDEAQCQMLQAAGQAAALSLAQLHSRQEAQASRQKLETVERLGTLGQLASGIAHDFNNLLSVILGYAELAKNSAQQNPQECEAHLQRIHGAARRGVDLVRQITAYSQHQPSENNVIDTNKVVSELGNLLKPLLGRNIELKLKLEEKLWPIQADISRLEQVLMNMVVNARDAMPHGGTLTIETQNITLNQAQAQQVLVPVGRYVQLSILDNGVGMDDQVLGHIFELFFTTKDKDHGTGIGLATAYGLVKQAGGNIWVSSQPGRGTTFKIYWPAS